MNQIMTPELYRLQKEQAKEISEMTDEELFDALNEED